jgi:quercetin dioxygenase-like cupin family protein
VSIAAVSAPQPLSMVAAQGLRLRIMLLMRIERWDIRRDGPLSEIALDQKLRALGYQTVLRTYPAGAISAAQADMSERAEAVVSGLIKVTLDGESAILTAGDVVFLPPGASRRLEVVGGSPAYCLEATSGSDN